MARSVVVLMFLLVVVSHEAEAVSADAGVSALLTDLFEKGGFGRLPTERAAFLRANGSGTIECVLWPKGAAFQRASFHGVIPDGVIAVAHTHPNREKWPSRGDHTLADRLGIPVLVVTRGGVTGARPGEAQPTKVMDRLPRASPGLQCTSQ